MLALRDIRKDYYGTTVLHGIDLELRRGEVHALLGENGAGKSTLMNVLFGMPIIHSTGGFQGRIELDGRPVQVPDPAAAMALGIGMVHQEFMLIPGFSVAENVKLNREPLLSGGLMRWLGRPGHALRTLDRSRMHADTARALARVELPVDPDTLAGGLPVGHLQFIEIAREVDKSGMRALVFDEPTAVLTEGEAKRLLAVMRGLAAEGLAILLITHRLDEVMQAADHVTILRDGARVLSAPRTQLTIESIAGTMVGRPMPEHPHPAGQSASGTSQTPEPGSPRRTLLEVRDLHVEQPGECVRGVDLAIEQGEILGLGGLAGQGKIGIANGILGLYPARGELLFDGHPLPLGDPRAARAAGLALVSEDRRGTGLLLDESLAMNIAIPAMEVRGAFLRPRALGGDGQGRRGRGARWLASLALIDRAAVRAHAEQAIAELDIRTTGPDQPVRRLSGGNQQKVCLAAALGTLPRLLFISEPTRGIDIGAKQLVLDRLLALNRAGLTIVMTSSELVELRTLCHRIAIIAEGRVAGILEPDASDVQFGLLMSGKSVA